MCRQAISLATGNATSSPGLEDGPSQPDLLGGQTTANCGPVPRRASRSASPGKEKPRVTIGTCGPTFSGSPVPDGPLSSWESRLRRRLARTGSTECVLTWKASATPAGRPLSRLVPSTRPTVVTVCGSSHDPALWVTASARDWKDSPGMATTRPDGRSRIDQLPRQVAAACWPTPTASLADKSIRTPEGAIREVERGKSPDLAAHAMAMWPTPLTQEAKHNEVTDWERTTTHAGTAGSLRVLAALGMVQDGSSATTEKPGALNPAFVCWLMGFQAEWDAYAPTEMPSSRKSRRK